MYVNFIIFFIKSVIKLLHVNIIFNVNNYLKKNEMTIETTNKISNLIYKHLRKFLRYEHNAIAFLICPN